MTDGDERRQVQCVVCGDWYDERGRCMHKAKGAATMDMESQMSTGDWAKRSAKEHCESNEMLHVPGTGMPDRPPWAPTWSGLRVCLLRPRPEQINLPDIALSLAGISRYAGLGETVAVHSLRTAAVLEAWRARPVAVLAGLVHDAPEAYTGDLTRPVQRLIGRAGMAAYRAAHARILDCLIAEVLALPVLPTPDDWALVKQADNAAGLAEARACGWSAADWYVAGEGPPVGMIEAAAAWRPACIDGGAAMWRSDVLTLVNAVFEAAARA
jgi:hypothetical protein